MIEIAIKVVGIIWKMRNCKNGAVNQSYEKIFGIISVLYSRLMRGMIRKLELLPDVELYACETM